MELNAIPWQEILSQIVFWSVLVAVLVFLALGGWFMMYTTSFKMKLTYWPVVGSGKDLESIDRPSKNRLRWNKDKTHWLALWPLFNKKEIEPFGYGLIYPGQNVYALKMGDDYIPMKISIGDVDKKNGVIEPIPYYAKRWQALQLKQNEVEFTKKNWWDENKSYIVAIVTVIACGAVCALTVWWSYEYGAQVLGQAKEVGQNFISNAIQNVAQQNAPA